MASTPPPPSPSALRAPRAPRHGPKHDNYEPYPTRYSARLASQRASRVDQTTPPPSHQNASARTGTAKRTLSPSSPDTANPSPKKATRSHPTAASRTSPLEREHTVPRTSPHHTSRSSAERALPTPAKTPAKKKVVNSDSSTSRSLFPPTSTPKRRRMDAPSRSNAGPGGIYVDEPLHAAKEESIPIHEDSRDRIPAPPKFLDDPFIGKARPVRRPVTRSAADRSHDEGVWFVHRGKKIFKRFDDMEDQGDDEDDLGLFANRPDLLANNPDILNSVKPLKRSEIKPRILFPAADSPVNEEEDVTDVEDSEPMSPTPNHIPSIMDSTPVFDSRESRCRAKLPQSPMPPRSMAPVPHIHLQGPNGGPATPGSAFQGSGLEFERSGQTVEVSASEEEPKPQTAFRDSPASSLMSYFPVSSKAQRVETRAERVKRLREAYGSPAPRTRAARAAQLPTTDASRPSA